MGWGDGRFDLRALGLGVPRTIGVRAMSELADQFERAFEGVQVVRAVIADVHPASTGRARTIKDIEIPAGELRLSRPLIRHPARLPILVKLR
jgi:hypothetical protein